RIDGDVVQARDERFASRIRRPATSRSKIAESELQQRHRHHANREFVDLWKNVNDRIAMAELSRLCVDDDEREE
ncbi:hypothetical protein WA026_019851, partial [Henosepilachna vigintioctopunctata]